MASFDPATLRTQAWLSVSRCLPSNVAAQSARLGRDRRFRTGRIWALVRASAMPMMVVMAAPPAEEEINPRTVPRTIAVVAGAIAVVRRIIVIVVVVSDHPALAMPVATMPPAPPRHLIYDRRARRCRLQSGRKGPCRRGHCRTAREEAQACHKGSKGYPLTHGSSLRLCVIHFPQNLSRTRKFQQP